MIYQKLLEFQKQNITIKKDATNTHFRSSYSSLNEVLEKVKGPLNALGIVIGQQPNVVEGVQGLVTTLLDTEDDTKVECFVPFIGATDMQKLGGAITYARRYSLIALLGLEDEDDDGNAASAPPQAPRRPTFRRAANTAAGPVDRDDQPFEGDIPELTID